MSLRKHRYLPYSGGTLVVQCTSNYAATPLLIGTGVAVSDQTYAKTYDRDAQ